MDINHPTPTVEPPEDEEFPPDTEATALELLRCLEEDWDYLSNEERYGTVHQTIKVLEE